MLFLIVLTVIAVTVAVVALQNGHAVTLSFLFWQFEAPVTLIIFAATASGLVIGGLIRFARAVRRWSHGHVGLEAGSRERSHAGTLRSARSRRLSPR
jgi:hypothetical protein